METKHISIPAILKVEGDTLSHMGEYLAQKDIKKVVIYFGNGLINLFGKKVLDGMEKAGIDVLKYEELDTVDIDDIMPMAFGLSNDTQAVIGIGGGKVIDATKYMCFLRKLPFISVPTSASSDGFCSSTASLIVNGRRSSVPATLAYGIIVDTDAIKSAPQKFIFSGMGDMVAKITAIYDWQFEAEKGFSTINDTSVMLAKNAVNSFVRMPLESISRDVFIRELVNGLTVSGLANEIAGGSAPTSGSEHLISHALDKLLPNPQLHGIQVGIATYIMSLVHEHRYERIRKFLTETGFFDYCKTLNLNKEDYIKAIDMAPAIKPFRHVYLHEEKFRQKAKQVILEDEILKEILE
ncbi:MAG: iron-containing alcohol dehydrogenase family protein [Lachnospiraceae bacterium]|nr:iron-containing alcohol dehydrogenase family protein [Lachnospiraceae bacterium]MEE0920381.1 iron-containing alcohol dehydrogenase family protein [Lachnospiraceae bacterium]